MATQDENKPKVISDKDKKQAKSRQNGGTRERMSQREAAAGLNLAGNNTMSGRTEQPMPTMSEREEAAGLNLAGNDTLSGRQSQEGNIYDVDTESYNPTFNKEGTDETILNDGIDEFGTGDDFGEVINGGGGGGDLNTFTLDVVKEDNTAGTATFFGEGVN